MKKDRFLRRAVTIGLIFGLAGGLPLVGVDLGVPQAIAQATIPNSVQTELNRMNAADLTQADRDQIAKDVMAAVLALPGNQQADVLAAAVSKVVGSNPNSSAANAAAFTGAVAALPVGQRENAGGAVGQGIGQAVVSLSATPAGAGAVATILNASAASTTPGIANGVSAGISAAIVASPNPAAAAANVIAVAGTAGVSTAAVQSIGTGIGSAVDSGSLKPADVSAINNAVANSNNTALASAATAVTAPVVVAAVVNNIPISAN